jgi:hypothetical protein
MKGPSAEADAALIQPDRRWWSSPPHKDAWLQPARTLLPMKLPSVQQPTPSNPCVATGDDVSG